VKWAGFFRGIEGRLDCLGGVGVDCPPVNVEYLRTVLAEGFGR